MSAPSFEGGGGAGGGAALVHRLVEARPPGAGVKLRVRAEEVRSARGALVRSAVLGVDVLAGEGRLGALAAQDLVLLGGELAAPLLVCLLDLLGHSILRSAVVQA